MFADQDQRQGRWIDDVPNGEVVRFLIWLALMVALAVASTVVIIHRAETRAPGDLGLRWLAGWAIVTGGTILLLAFLGGLLVFGARAKWEVVGTWPWLGGIGIGIGYYVTLVSMGQTEPGSVTCGKGQQGCDIAMGFGAGLLALVTSLLIGSSSPSTDCGVSYHDPYKPRDVGQDGSLRPCDHDLR